MKNRRIVWVAILLAMIASGCETKQSTKGNSSSGKTCEVLVAADREHYTKETQSIFDSILRKPQACLPQEEPRFDVVYVPLSSLHNTHMFRMHRNIIMCEVKEGNDNKVYMHHNQWAEPQTVVDIVANDEAALQMLLRSHAEQIVEAIYADEYARMGQAFYKDRNVELMRRVEEKYGFRLTLPQDFMWASESGDFVWLRKETKDFGLGIMINTMPYKDASLFDQKKIWNRLDTVMKRNVGGPADGSYMSTERRVPFETRIVPFGKAKYCIETRGLWRLVGDFMGGPFVSYCMLSPDGHEVVELTGYVYCPRFDKRDYLMQVDGICHSIEWE